MDIDKRIKELLYPKEKELLLISAQIREILKRLERLERQKEAGTKN